VERQDPIALVLEVGHVEVAPRELPLSLEYAAQLRGVREVETGASDRYMMQSNGQRAFRRPSHTLLRITIEMSHGRVHRIGVKPLSGRVGGGVRGAMRGGMTPFLVRSHVCSYSRRH
jgi:hypothetical protein